MSPACCFAGSYIIYYLIYLKVKLLGYVVSVTSTIEYMCLGESSWCPCTLPWWPLAYPSNSLLLTLTFSHPVIHLHSYILLLADVFILSLYLAFTLCCIDWRIIYCGMDSPKRPTPASHLSWVKSGGLFHVGKLVLSFTFTFITYGVQSIDNIFIPLIFPLVKRRQISMVCFSTVFLPTLCWRDWGLCWEPSTLLFSSRLLFRSRYTTTRTICQRFWFSGKFMCLCKSITTQSTRCWCSEL